MLDLSHSEVDKQMLHSTIRGWMDGFALWFMVYMIFDYMYDHLKLVLFQD